MITNINEYKIFLEINQKLIDKINNLEIIEDDKHFGKMYEPPYKTDDYIPPLVDKLSRGNNYINLPSHIQILKFDDLIKTQNIVFKNSLLKLIDENITTPLLVFKYDNKYYLIDGNHRLTIQYLQGIMKYKCLIYNLDSLNESKQVGLLYDFIEDDMFYENKLITYTIDEIVDEISNTINPDIQIKKTFNLINVGKLKFYTKKDKFSHSREFHFDLYDYSDYVKLRLVFYDGVLDNSYKKELKTELNDTINNLIDDFKNKRKYFTCNEILNILEIELKNKNIKYTIDNAITTSSKYIIINNKIKGRISDHSPNFTYRNDRTNDIDFYIYDEFASTDEINQKIKHIINSIY